MTAATIRIRCAPPRSFVAAQMPGARDVTVLDLAPISSVGNARQAWGFNTQWRDGDGVCRA